LRREIPKIGSIIKSKKKAHLLILPIRLAYNPHSFPHPSKNRNLNITTTLIIIKPIKEENEGTLIEASIQLQSFNRRWRRKHSVSLE